MNLKKYQSLVPAGLGRRRLLPLLLLVPLCALITGCPHNDYTVELKPTAHGVERTLTFYRVDGTNSEAFPTNELAAITRAYPVGAVTEGGNSHVAKGEFAGAMPQDVGGAGTFTNCVSSLGESGFYCERFRGEDDLAAKTLKQFQAADQLTDLAIGWSKTEFGREHGYKKLREFLDGDFRQDLKNGGQYFQLGAVSELLSTNAPEEFMTRFCQYLTERGYLKPAEFLKLPSIIGGNGDESALLGMIQRLVAGKMEIPATEPLPKSLAILTNAAALQKSWEQYLAQTGLYRAKHKEWAALVKANPKLEEPKPANAAAGLFTDLLGISTDFGSTADHLTVKLALKSAPDHSNGKWQNGQVVWETDLAPDRPLPVLCYASWNYPDEPFQKAHFARVILDGDELSKYDLWRSGLAQKEGEEWDAFLAGLQPGPELKGKIEAAQPVSGDNQEPFAAGRKMLVEALAKNAEAVPAGANLK